MHITVKKIKDLRRHTQKSCFGPNRWSEHTGSFWQGPGCEKWMCWKSDTPWIALRLPSVGSREKERIRKLPSFHVLHLDLGSTFAFELPGFNLRLQGAQFPCSVWNFPCSHLLSTLLIRHVVGRENTPSDPWKWDALFSRVFLIFGSPIFLHQNKKRNRYNFLTFFPTPERKCWWVSVQLHFS